MFSWVFRRVVSHEILELSRGIKEEYEKRLVKKFNSGGQLFDLFALFHVQMASLVAKDLFQGL